MRLPLPCCKSQKMSKALVGLKVMCRSQIQLLVLTVSLFVENQGQLPILTPKLLSILTALRIVDILAWIHAPSNSTIAMVPFHRNLQQMGRNPKRVSHILTTFSEFNH